MPPAAVLSAEARHAGLRDERIRASAQFRDGQFHNVLPVSQGLKGNPLPVMGKFLFKRGERTPRVQLPMLDPRGTWTTRAETELRVTWLGHSTVLLEMDGRRVLTDPVFGMRASPFAFAGPKRFHPTPVRIDELPELDAVLISHDHYDHLCKESVEALARRNVPFVTSLGVGAHLEAFGVPAENIHELDWWESHELPGGLKLTATPSQHFSGRGLHDRNTTLWSSWVIRTENRKVFFSGDTGFTEAYGEIGRRMGPFDLVMLEVGAWDPSWGDIHLGPHNALKVHQLLGGGTLLPVHWGTFNLGLHDWDEPAETLWTEAAKQSVRVLTPKLGEVFEPGRIDTLAPWWRGLPATR